MNIHKNILRLNYLLILGLTSAAGLCADSIAPNILLILADDLGYRDLSIQGCKQFETPQIDSIARNGIRFTDGYVSNSVCSPSRAGLMSGRVGIGFESNLVPHSVMGLDVSLPTMADYLKEAGYRTYIVGKWHLGYKPEYHPNRRGFDEFYGLLHGSRTYYADNLNRLIRSNEALQRNGEYEPEPEGSYVTDRLTAGAIDYITQHVSENPDQPFFMYLSHTAPHGPWEAKPGYAERYPHIKNDRRRIYAGMIASLDEGVGQVIECLKENGIYDNTLIVFLSDNGGPTGKAPTDNAPLKGSKGTLWEGGVRVPFLLQWPAKVPAGQVLDEPVSSLDLLPTFLAAAGQNTDIHTDGKDLTDYIVSGKPAPGQRPFFWRRNSTDYGALRLADYKWIVRRKDSGDEVMVFNLEKDIGEHNDLAMRMPDLANRMGQIFDAWEASATPPHFNVVWNPETNRYEEEIPDYAK